MRRSAIWPPSSNGKGNALRTAKLIEINAQLGTHLDNFDWATYLSSCGFEVGNQPAIASRCLSHQTDELASGVLDQFTKTVDGPAGAIEIGLQLRSDSPLSIDI